MKHFFDLDILLIICLNGALIYITFVNVPINKHPN